jgi:hypothetical protein
MNITPASASPPHFVGGSDRSSANSFARAVGYLTAAGSAALGLGVAAIAWILAAVSFDGATLFGCSDGYKHPDPGAGYTCIAIGLVALLIGFGISHVMWSALRRSANN